MDCICFNLFDSNVLNPITNGIFSFRQLRGGGGGGGFLAQMLNDRVRSGNLIDLKFCTVIVLDKAIKFTKFQENTIALS